MWQQKYHIHRPPDIYFVSTSNRGRKAAERPSRHSTKTWVRVAYTRWTRAKVMRNSASRYLVEHIILSRTLLSYRPLYVNMVKFDVSLSPGCRRTCQILVGKVFMSSRGSTKIFNKPLYWRSVDTDMQRRLTVIVSESCSFDTFLTWTNRTEVLCWTGIASYMTLRFRDFRIGVLLNASWRYNLHSS